ncbi:hypothetical protein B0T20DRAFT_401054 [Sordaria brevicollis]|uniref:Uncharacterized protein n=1 Tax=Sordaria brevicollis TaxID=83679 RepID=A0AAE0PNX4_SORBR|nr:hypothetical protein B0T20DRAFT_401054 [Sordaria brevicollis]
MSILHYDIITYIRCISAFCCYIPELYASFVPAPFYIIRHIPVLERPGTLPFSTYHMKRNFSFYSHFGLRIVRYTATSCHFSYAFIVSFSVFLYRHCIFLASSSLIPKRVRFRPMVSSSFLWLSALIRFCFWAVLGKKVMV